MFKQLAFAAMLLLGATSATLAEDKLDFINGVPLDEGDQLMLGLSCEGFYGQFKNPSGTAAMNAMVVTFHVLRRYPHWRDMIANNGDNPILREFSGTLRAACNSPDMPHDNMYRLIASVYWTVRTERGETP